MAALNNVRGKTNAALVMRRDTRASHLEFSNLGFHHPPGWRCFSVIINAFASTDQAVVGIVFSWCRCFWSALIMAGRS
jgi:hypothetical protein